MRLLVIGGTRFVGRAVTAAALARGHAVTLFHRGRTRSDLFPEAERILGDRTRDLERLAGHRWDAVVDTCGFASPVVRASAAALKDAVGLYVFVSTLSVYADNGTPGQDETAPLAAHPDAPEDEDVLETYGARKALCEAALAQTLPGRVLVARAGLIVGPWDYVDRFPYWVRRVAEGGEVLAPGAADRPLQLIDVRDLGEWLVRLAERGDGGTFNATGPQVPIRWSEMLEALRDAAASAARFTWVDDDFLLAHGVTPFAELPLWVPAGMGDGFMRYDVRRALAAGLTLRPLVETARDTLAWDRARAPAHEPEPPERVRLLGPVGMARERERALLAEWAAREGAS